MSERMDGINRLASEDTNYFAVPNDIDNIINQLPAVITAFQSLAMNLWLW